MHHFEENERETREILRNRQLFQGRRRPDNQRQGGRADLGEGHVELRGRVRRGVQDLVPVRRGGAEVVTDYHDIHN